MSSKEVYEAFRGEYSCVDRWLKRVPGYEQHLHYLYNFVEWLGSHVPKDAERVNQFYGLDLNGVLKSQRSLGYNERYGLVDFLQDYVMDYYGSKGTKDTLYAVVRSFFRHNRAELPKDGLRFKGDYEPEPMDMRLDEFRAILREANLLYRSVFMTKFQGMMGTEEVVYFSNNCWPTVDAQLRKGSMYLGSKERVIVHFPGRKGVVRPYFTSVERDGIDLLKSYISKWRGPVKPGEPIYLNSRGTSLSHSNVEKAWISCCFKAGIIEPKTPECEECGGPTFKKRKYRKGVKRTYYICTECGHQRTALKNPSEEERRRRSRIRYGKGTHEGCRDLTRSRWCKSKAKEWVAEFRMGHPVDSNNYKKIMQKDPHWGEGQFELASPWLNVLSEDPERVSVYEYQSLERELEDTRRVIRDAEWLLSDPETQRILRGLVEERKGRKR